VAAVDGIPVASGIVAQACFDYWKALP